jgi:hypothetical protein
MQCKVIWGEKWTKHLDDESMHFALQEWSDALVGIEPTIVEKAARQCKMIFSWPPSVAEFLEVCENEMGYPNVDQVMNGCIRREFSHELIKMVFDRIGSHAFGKDSEEIIRRKIKDALDESIKLLRMSRCYE